MSLAIFQQQVTGAATELVAQDVEKLNAASNGALIMGTGSAIGDYIEQSSWKLIANLAVRRNAYDNTGKQTPEGLNQILDRVVKVDGGIKPIQMSPAMMERLGKNVSEVSAVVAAQASAAVIQDYLNVVLAALKAAFQAKAAGAAGSVWTEIPAPAGGTAGETESADLISLTKAVRPFGDRQQAIVAWAMSGAAYNDFLTGGVLKNSNQLFVIGNVRVMDDGFGRVFIVTDSPALADGSILGLVMGAGVVQTSGVQMYADTQLGGVNVQNIVQGEYIFHVGLKGYALADSVATAIAKTASITDAQLQAKASWNQIATDIKDTAGVLLTFAAAK